MIRVEFSGDDWPSVVTDIQSFLGGMPGDALPDEATPAKKPTARKAKAKAKPEPGDAGASTELDDAEKVPSEDDLRAAAQQMIKRTDGDAEPFQKILAEYGFERLSAVSPEKRAEIIEKVNAVGVD